MASSPEIFLNSDHLLDGSKAQVKLLSGTSALTLRSSLVMHVVVQAFAHTCKSAYAKASSA